MTCAGKRPVVAARRIGTILGSVFLLAVMTLVLGHAALGADEFVVRSQVIDDKKAVFATIEASDQTIARARIGGTVFELTIDEGSAVEEGQVIGRVVDPKLALELRAMDSRIDSVSEQVKLARIEYGRAEQLFQKGTIAKSRLDSADTALKVLLRNLAAARAERSVTVERQKEGEIRAPSAGRVLRVEVTRGKVVLAGESIAVITANAYVLRLQLPERHARFIKIGDPVIVAERGMALVPRVADLTHVGRVQKVYPEIRQGRVAADVAVDDLGDFFVGERVRVLVSTGTRNAFVVPVNFLSHRFGLSFARLKDGGDTVVQTGVPTQGGIEILSGLADGDVLLAPKSDRGAGS